MSTRRVASYIDAEKKTITIPSEAVKAYTPTQLVNDVARLMVTGRIAFPWKRHSYALATIRANLKRFSELPYECRYDPYKSMACVSQRTPFIDFTYEDASQNEEDLEAVVVSLPDDDRVRHYTVQFDKKAVAVAEDGAPSDIIKLAKQVPREKRCHVTIITHVEWYECFHIIADWFTEPCRLRARFSNLQQSPLEYWHSAEGAEHIARECIQRYNQVSSYHLREAMYPNVKECENFKASLAYLVYTRILHLTEKDRVLDFCAGWGDRLVGALAAGIAYTGVDANAKLQPLYEELIATLAPDSGEKYCMISGDFIDAKLPDKTYRGIFTCPPYFTKELYDDGKAQSVQRYPKLEQWTRDFLCASLQKAWNVLEPGGRMAIVLADVGRDAYCEAMVLYASAFLTDCDFRGVISYAPHTMRDRNHLRQPIWVFERLAKDTSEARRERVVKAKVQAKKYLTSEYPFLAK